MYLKSSLARFSFSRFLPRGKQWLIHPGQICRLIFCLFSLQNDSLVFSSTSTSHLCISSVYFTVRRGDLLNLPKFYRTSSVSWCAPLCTQGQMVVANWPIRVRDFLLLCYNYLFLAPLFFSVFCLSTTPLSSRMNHFQIIIFSANNNNY